MFFKCRDNIRLGGDLPLKQMTRSAVKLWIFINPQGWSTTITRSPLKIQVQLFFGSFNWLKNWKFTHMPMKEYIFMFWCNCTSGCGKITPQRPPLSSSLCLIRIKTGTRVSHKKSWCNTLFPAGSHFEFSDMRAGGVAVGALKIMKMFITSVNNAGSPSTFTNLMRNSTQIAVGFVNGGGQMA